MKKITFCNNYSIFFWLVAIAVLVLYDLTPRIDGFDKYYYFLAGEHLWNGQIDCLRTPVYPFLLKLSCVFFGEKGGIVGIIILQSIIYLISVVSLRNIAKLFIKNRFIQWFVPFMYIICVAPGWCNEMMTESLSISGCIIIVDMMCKYIEKPTFRLSIGIVLLTIFFVFLRPSFIFLFAILPFIWIILWIRNNRRLIQTLSFVFTLLCITAYFGYCKAYEKEYGVFTSSISFVCNDIYNLKRSGAWDIDKVSDQKAKEVIKKLDAEWGGNYSPIYNAVNSNHKDLKLITQGCKEMKQASKSTLQRHQLMITIGSFDKRFNASVNTHTTLSAILFGSSLFLALPLSIFYSIVVISCLAMVGYFVQKRTIPLIATVIILSTAAQCIGIVLFASEAHERLLLPVYPLFLVLLGIAVEKAIKLFTH
ncbi:MAG: hypothetical protein J6X58_03270 [Bacteroidales bacterium]|nr:hypothetical protein [Bacteroidales bacterium]